MDMTCHFPDKHEQTVKTAQSQMPAAATLARLADAFKTFGDPTRVRILWALSVGEMCVGHLAELLQMEQSAVSHQLRVLRQARLVRFRKEGRSAVYALDDDHVQHILQLGLSHVEEVD